MNNIKQYDCDIAVIGGGAAGLMAGIAASGNHKKIIIFEACDKPGKKIYATGNGRCNLTNNYINDNCYHTGSAESVTARFDVFNAEKLKDFFTSGGILLHDRSGYVYPRTDQAAVIVEYLTALLNEKSVSLLCLHTVKELKRDNGLYSISGRFNEGLFICHASAVIVTTGGMCGRAFGCKGDGYHIAESFGHHIIPPVPALTQLLCQDTKLKICSGVRCQADIKIIIDGKVMGESEGELQMTDKGVSGIPVFQISHFASRALYNAENKTMPPDVRVRIDFVPELSSEEWEKEISRRLKKPDKSRTVHSLFMGLVHPSIASYIIRSSNFDGKELADEKKIGKILQTGPEYLYELLNKAKCLELSVCGVEGFEKAQVTSGGIALQEISDTMESRNSSGLYFAGEVIDVDGICGGYNLTWAMCTGYMAGSYAAGKVLS